jgi:hypothetical protein
MKIYEKRKGEPVPEGATDGIAELIEGDEDFVYSRDTGESAQEILASLRTPGDRPSSTARSLVKPLALHLRTGRTQEPLP